MQRSGSRIVHLAAVILSAALVGCVSPTSAPEARSWPTGISTLNASISASSVTAKLPKDIALVAPAASVSAGRRAFAGIWRGWICKGKQCDAKLAVEQVTSTGAIAVYAAASHLGGDPFVQRGAARFFDQEMVMTLRTGSVLVARLRNSSEMEVMVWRKSGKLLAYGVLTNKPFEFTRVTERAPMSRMQNGKPVTLELIRFKPNGNGPFPTVIMNHGSTTPAQVGLPWISPDLVGFFTSRGWQIAFPQRRGRGRSGGVYNEGYELDRSDYSCDPAQSIPGMDRAIEDTKAVLNYIKAHSDVDATKLLMSGVSRGGILSIAFAGQYPESVAGVVNFVGGWMGEPCKNIDRINPVLFERGAAYPRPTLWLYGENDPFYSIKHSRSNFDRFIRSGGRGEFNVYAPQQGSGHWLHLHPALWKDAVDAYLNQIE